MFGLFHGLIFLPVLLSMFGSEFSLSSLEDERDKEEKTSSRKLLEMQPMSGVSNGKGHKETMDLTLDINPNEELLPPVYNNNKILATT